MFRRKADRLQEELAHEDLLAEAGRPRGRVAAAQAAKKRDRRSDLTVAALGITLGLICALFPWYIFFNPDEFGIRAMRFGGGGNGTMPIVLGAQPDRVGAPVSIDENPPLELDLLSTGTAVKEKEEPQDVGEAADVEQAFPPPVATFRVVQIANGRAMLADDTGLFVVQPGSILPDSSRVESIEERAGRPVLVTDAGMVLEISE